MVIDIGAAVASVGVFDWRVNTFEAKVKKELVDGLIVKVRAPQIRVFY